MKKKLKKEMLGGLLVIVICAVALLTISSFFFNKPGIKLSCSEGKLLGFGKTSMPPACMACIPDCHGEVTITDLKDNLICKNIAEEFGNIVLVPCPELKNYKKQELKISYLINSSNGSFKGEENRIYNG